MNYTATYSPDDNKLRLYASSRLDAETYARVKAAGFRWAPKQDLFVAPAWTPEREDLLVDLAGEIGDEDTSLTDRAEQRADRFETYSEHRKADADAARRAVSAIADNIPLGQPIFVGHHSERHARRDAEKIKNGMRRAVKMWKTSTYWTSRAAGAIHHAKYKERPDVRARRIKTLEAEQRKVNKAADGSRREIKLWSLVNAPHKDGRPCDDDLRMARAKQFANVSSVYLSQDDPRGYNVWTALDKGNMTPAEAMRITVKANARSFERAKRWSEHLVNRLAYERAMLADAGGTVADKTGPEKGGACRCWASHRGGWSWIQKVNKVSVTVLDNWGNADDKSGTRNFTRTIPFDKLAAVMTKADVDAKRAADVLREYDDKTGFFLLDSPPPAPVRSTTPDEDTRAFEALADSLRAGVQIVGAPQLFPTPADLAARMVDLADIEFDNRVLEPSAGTGALVEAIQRRAAASQGVTIVAVEINATLADRLGALRADFLECNGNLGTFDRIVMNPPFGDASDIKHIQHARTMLRPGGILVALCANGPRQNDQLKPLAESWEDLPAGTFAGTGVRAALLVIRA